VTERDDTKKSEMSVVKAEAVVIAGSKATLLRFRIAMVPAAKAPAFASPKKLPERPPFLKEGIMITVMPRATARRPAMVTLLSGSPRSSHPRNTIRIGAVP